MSKAKLLLGIISIWVLLFNISCQRKSIISESEKIKADTIYSTHTEYKYKAVHDTLVIDNPCDSAGLLTSFYSKLSTPQGTVIIRTINHRIVATINLDSVSQVYNKLYKSKYNSQFRTIDKTIIKTHIPSWLIYILILETLMIGLYIFLKTNRLIN